MNLLTQLKFSRQFTEEKAKEELMKKQAEQELSKKHESTSFEAGNFINNR